MGEDLHAPGAGQGQRIDRRHVHMLDRLGKQATEHADRVNAEGEGARKWPKSDGGDEQQRPNQVRNGAGEADHAARGVVEVARRRHVHGRENWRAAEP